ncbi:MAG TPA: phenylacetate-CoA oxygenase subunit PaaJ, partial [Chitinophagaceae bacterium]|nr:phenylacetate-CoA oxygenase subunit PaaJ [Chitinophagaceae bacterium]
MDIKQLENRIWQILARIADPEVPVLTILDLGIVREVIADDTGVQVSITPTYSGCPAMDMIATQIRMELLSEGFNKVDIKSI